MKNVICILAALFAASVSNADIRPPTSNKSTVLTVEDYAAAELWESLSGENVKTLPGDSLRTYASTYKVFTTSDETFRIICVHGVGTLGGNRTETYSCKAEKAKNGKRLAPFNPPRRLG